MKWRFAGGIGYIGHAGMILMGIHNLVRARQAGRPEQEKGEEDGYQFHLCKDNCLSKLLVIKIES
jgi:hypothetical protein